MSTTPQEPLNDDDMETTGSSHGPQDASDADGADGTDAAAEGHGPEDSSDADGADGTDAPAADSDGTDA
jgi:hypothetical protein